MSNKTIHELDSLSEIAQNDEMLIYDNSAGADNPTKKTTVGTIKDFMANNIKDVYSTDEVKTNKVWIDGKPIYRKVNPYEVSSTSDSYFDLGLLNIQNVETIINAQVTRFILNDYGYQILNSTVVLYNGHLYVDKAWTGNVGLCYVILEYTKTKD